MKDVLNKLLAVFLAAGLIAAAATGCGSEEIQSGDTIIISSDAPAEVSGTDTDPDVATTQPESEAGSSQTEETSPATTSVNESAEYAAWGYVHTSSGGNANIRAEANANADIVGNTKSECMIRIFDRSSDKKWYKVKCKDRYGYIAAVNVIVKKYAIIVYKGDQTVVVYKNGDLSEAKVFRCSTGRKGHATPSKDYYITTTLKGRIANYTWRDLKGGVFGQYGTTISPYYLFHSLPYKSKGKNASMDKSGYQALLDGKADSDGCIRLCVRDAKWIFEKCDKFTTVRITDEKSGKESTEIYPALKKGQNADGVSYSGWDPTDPAEDNPYRED